MGRLRRVVGIAFMLAMAAVGGAGCSTDIFDLEVELEAQSYAFDFGKSQGTIPTVTCDPGAPSICGTAPRSPSIRRWACRRTSRSR